MDYDFIPKKPKKLKKNKRSFKKVLNEHVIDLKIRTIFAAFYK